MPNTNDREELESVNQEMYKKNLELAVTNKTLSLLQKLYEISLLTLDINALSEKISETIREGLNFELAGILQFNEETDTLVPMHFSRSEKLEKTLEELDLKERNVEIPNITGNSFFNPVIYGKTESRTNSIGEVWGDIISSQNIGPLAEASHIKTMLAYPLSTENRVLGSILLGLNREYETLNTYEQDSIKSFVPVIAIALDKAYVYKELADANEKLKSLDQLKTEFLSLASHQLRSPLTAIKGYTSMLLDGSFGSVNNEQKEAIDRVFQSSNHLTKTVEDLLNVTKIEQGGMKYEMVPFDFGKTVKEIANDLSITAEKKDLEFKFQTDNDEQHMVNGDMEKIRQVIINLVDNSIKYTAKGFIHAKVEKTTDHKILLSISDSGMGMTPEIKATLFQKFSRGEGGKVNSGGSGLGLYLAKEIVEAHKGRVWVESPGKGLGSTFYVELEEYSVIPD